MQATLIQCTKSKRDEAAAARDLYDDSDYYCKMRAYALARDQPWFILSAKHGLLRPRERVEPYDDFGLSEDQCKEIAQSLASMCVTEVELIAGSKYSNPLTPELERYGIEVIERCRGLKIGSRMARLSELIHEVKNEQLC